MPRNVIPARDVRNDEAEALAQAGLRAALAVAPDQESLAEWCGVDRATVSRWKRGLAPVNVAALLRPRRVRAEVLSAMRQQLDDLERRARN